MLVPTISQPNHQTQYPLLPNHLYSSLAFSSVMASLFRFHCDPTTELDRFFDDACNARFWPSGKEGGAYTSSTRHLDSFRPRMDVKKSEDSNDVTATFELPGLKAENISIDLQQNLLTVSGEYTADNAQEGTGYAVRERRYGKFARTLQLPFGTKAEDVKAKMENGLLTVSFPKAAPEQQPQQITIQ